MERWVEREERECERIVRCEIREGLVVVSLIDFGSREAGRRFGGSGKGYHGGRGSDWRMLCWREAREVVSWARRWRVCSRVFRSVGVRVVIVGIVCGDGRTKDVWLVLCGGRLIDVH